MELTNFVLEKNSSHIKVFQYYNEYNKDSNFIKVFSDKNYARK